LTTATQDPTATTTDNTTLPPPSSASTHTPVVSTTTAATNTAAVAVAAVATVATPIESTAAQSPLKKRKKDSSDYEHSEADDDVERSSTSKLKRRRNNNTDPMREGRSANDSHSPSSHSYSNGHTSPTTTFSKSVNGHSHLVSRPETNGSSHAHSNGFTPVKSFPPVWLGHDREEVTRILIQGLNELGYSSSANALSRESGYELEDDTVSHFRRAVLDGKWPEAERLLFGDEYIDAGGGFSNGASGKIPDSSSKRKNVGLGLLKGANRREMLFWMRQQKYLELLENRDLDTALMVLRQELTPMHQDTDRLHLLGG
jgi:hypothetical protein